MNQKNCVNINFAHEKFLNRKTNPPEKFSYIINEFDMGNVFRFTYNYFDEPKILNYIDLHDSHLDCEYDTLSKKEAIICLKKSNSEQKYEVDSFVLNKYLLRKARVGFKLETYTKLDRDNDYIVIIGFKSIREPLKNLLP